MCARVRVRVRVRVGVGVCVCVTKLCEALEREDVEAEEKRDTESKNTKMWGITLGLPPKW